MRDEASCILVSLKLSDYANVRVDDILSFLDLVMGWPELDEKDDNRHV